MPEVASDHKTEKLARRFAKAYDRHDWVQHECMDGGSPIANAKVMVFSGVHVATALLLRRAMHNFAEHVAEDADDLERIRYDQEGLGEIAMKILMTEEVIKEQSWQIKK